MTIFFEIAAALVLAAVCGGVLYSFRQPTIIGFIFAGIIIGYFGFIREGVNLELVEGLSSIGVALLLFIVGLEMRFGDIKEVGRHAVIAGVAQIVMTIAVVYFVAPLFGITGAAIFYVGAALAFSSTVIVIKLLSEMRDLSSLYGRISIGILLVQDIIAIVILIFLAGLDQGGGQISGFVTTFLKGGAFVVLAVFISRLAPKFLDFLSRSPELLYLFSLAWAVGVSALFASPWVGLSIEIGGFLAGLALANSSEHFQIGAKMKPLRDFFLIIFFIGLGARMLGGGGVELALPVIVFSLIVLIGNPLMVALALSLSGYRSRTSFLAGLTTSQISEFSFILMFLGIRLGHIESSHVSIIAMVGIVTIFFSSYLILYGQKVYSYFRPALGFLDKLRKNYIEERVEDTDLDNHIVLVGVHRMGQGILQTLSNMSIDFVAVDFDPKVVKRLRSQKLPIVYGDVSDPEILELIGLSRAKVLISTMPSYDGNLALLEFIKKNNPEAKTILTARNEHEAELFYRAGVDYVILPQYLGGAEIARLITRDPEFATLESMRERDMPNGAPFRY